MSPFARRDRGLQAHHRREALVGSGGRRLCPLEEPCGARTRCARPAQWSRRASIFFFADAIFRLVSPEFLNPGFEIGLRTTTHRAVARLQAAQLVVSWEGGSRGVEWYA